MHTTSTVESIRLPPAQPPPPSSPPSHAISLRQPEKVTKEIAPTCSCFSAINYTSIANGGGPDGLHAQVSASPSPSPQLCLFPASCFFWMLSCLTMRGRRLSCRVLVAPNWLRWAAFALHWSGDLMLPICIFFSFFFRKTKSCPLMLRKVVEELDEFSVFYFLFWWEFWLVVFWWLIRCIWGGFFLWCQFQIFDEFWPFFCWKPLIPSSLEAFQKVFACELCQFQIVEHLRVSYILCWFWQVFAWFQCCFSKLCNESCGE